MGLAPNGFAPPTVTWEALRAWRREMRIGRLETWEARALVYLGMVRASVLSEKKPDSDRPPPRQPPPTIGAARMLPPSRAR